MSDVSFSAGVILYLYYRGATTADHPGQGEIGGGPHGRAEARDAVVALVNLRG
jgi:hypothetical protein